MFFLAPPLTDNEDEAGGDAGLENSKDDAHGHESCKITASSMYHDSHKVRNRNDESKQIPSLKKYFGSVLGEGYAISSFGTAP